jgi:hypothetical protein
MKLYYDIVYILSIANWHLHGKDAIRKKEDYVESWRDRCPLSEN